MSQHVIPVLDLSGQHCEVFDRKTESQNPERGAELRAYLEQELQPAFAELDFESRLVESPSGKAPFLVAEHRESASAPTVLMYGHGDVVDGMAGEWHNGLDPWRMTTVGNRVYGRGTADNKGQHSINLAALRVVREARGGRLGACAAAGGVARSVGRVTSRDWASAGAAASAAKAVKTTRPAAMLAARLRLGAAMGHLLLRTNLPATVMSAAGPRSLRRPRSVHRRRVANLDGIAP